MSIVSSALAASQRRKDGRINYTEHHVDHTGQKHKYTYVGPEGADPQVIMAARAAKLPRKLAVAEQAWLEFQIGQGADPATLEHPHHTNAEALVIIIRHSNRLPPENIVKVAEFLDASVTDTQLDNVFSPAIRVKIRARVASVLAMKAGLDADKVLREDANQTTIDGGF